MQFVIHAYDATDDQAYERRMAVRPDHLKNMASVKEKGRVICAGGMTNEVGRLKGSVVIVEFPTRQDLDDYLAREPYILNKVWEKITIDTINVVLVNDEKV